MSTLTSLPVWVELKKHKQEISETTMKQMFAENNHRFDDFKIEFNDLLLDYSKNIINAKTLSLLTELAEQCNLKENIEKMFTGDKINFTEGRAVLHTALRSSLLNSVYVDNVDVIPEIQKVKKQIKKFCHAVHLGEFAGFTGKRFKDVVNIGIGGSDLGPAMICKALQKYALPCLNVHFVSNVDASHILETLKNLNPETTLFIIASKTFTTQETLANANTAKIWFLEGIRNLKLEIGNGIKVSEDNSEFPDSQFPVLNSQSPIEKHFIALSTNEAEVVKFGINPKNIFQFWDWVGGRYSLWSAIGLSIALYIGYDNFEELLAGACEMDIHFRNTPFQQNIPVILGLLGVWYSNFFEAKTNAIIPYDQYLEYLPDFLQQLDMESNGKYITKEGEKVDYSTGPVIWGKPGTNAQHSFFQLIHQGTQMIPADFLAQVHNLNVAIGNWELGNGNKESRNRKLEIGKEKFEYFENTEFANSQFPIPNSLIQNLNEHHEILLSNFFAQTEALMKGKSVEEALAELKSSGLSENEIKSLLPHKIFQGNKPTNTILYKMLTPRNLGSIIAMYEHKVFVQGIIWKINSFDQWGVELGKQLAKAILPQLENNEIISNHDSSTNGLINWYKRVIKL